QRQPRASPARRRGAGHGTRGPPDEVGGVGTYHEQGSRLTHGAMICPRRPTFVREGGCGGTSVRPMSLIGATHLTARQLVLSISPWAPLSPVTHRRRGRRLGKRQTLEIPGVTPRAPIPLGGQIAQFLFSSALL